MNGCRSFNPFSFGENLMRAKLLAGALSIVTFVGCFCVPRIQPVPQEVASSIFGSFVSSPFDLGHSALLENLGYCGNNPPSECYWCLSTNYAACVTTQTCGWAPKRQFLPAQGAGTYKALDEPTTSYCSMTTCAGSGQVVYCGATTVPVTVGCTKSGID
jgi:hypothetical protein